MEVRFRHGQEPEISVRLTRHEATMLMTNCVSTRNELNFALRSRVLQLEQMDKMRGGKKKPEEIVLPIVEEESNG